MTKTTTLEGDKGEGGGSGGTGNKNEGAEPQRMPWQERVAVSLHLLEMMSSSDDCSAGITWQADTHSNPPSLTLPPLSIPRGNT